MTAPGPVPIHHLTTAQRRVLEWVDRYEQFFDAPCPVYVVARQTGLHRSTVQQHIEALHRKGWLRTGQSPVRLAAPIPR